MDPILLHLPKLLLLGEAGQMPVLTLGQWPLVVTIPSAVLTEAIPHPVQSPQWSSARTVNTGEQHV